MHDRLSYAAMLEHPHFVERLLWRFGADFRNFGYNTKSLLPDLTMLKPAQLARPGQAPDLGDAARLHETAAETAERADVEELAHEMHLGSCHGGSTAAPACRASPAGSDPSGRALRGCMQNKMRAWRHGANG